MDTTKIFLKGKEAEREAIELLKKEGFNIFYPLKFDILAEKDNIFYAVEVKKRSNVKNYHKWVLRKTQIKFFENLPSNLNPLVVFFDSNNNGKIIKDIFKVSYSNTSKISYSKALKENEKEFFLIVGLLQGTKNSFSIPNIEKILKIDYIVVLKSLGELLQQNKVRKIETSAGAFYEWIK